jgi:hypothetical protein
MLSGLGPLTLSGLCAKCRVAGVGATTLWPSLSPCDLFAGCVAFTAFTDTVRQPLPNSGAQTELVFRAGKRPPRPCGSAAGAAGPSGISIGPVAPPVGSSLDAVAGAQRRRLVAAVEGREGIGNDAG